MAWINGTDRNDRAAQPQQTRKAWPPILISTLAHASLLMALAGWKLAPDSASGSVLSLAFDDRAERSELQVVEIPPADRPEVEPPPEETAVASEAIDSPADVAVPELEIEREAPADTEWYFDLHAPPTATRLAPAGSQAGAGASSLTSAQGTGDGSGDSSKGPPIRFFGAEAYGEKVVFVLDRSRSMRGTRLAVLKQEFRDCVERLQPQTQFNVIFFGYWFYERDDRGLRPATGENKEQMLQWVRAMEANESTVVAPAIERALKYEPDVIFFLTDGKFSPWVIQNITQKNARRIPIHTIGLKNPYGSRVLTELARSNDGQFTFVP